MNKFFGLSAASGVLRIDLSRVGLKTRDGEQITAIGTGDPTDPQLISTLALEIDIDAGAAAPVLSLKASQSDPQTLGLITMQRQFTYAPSASGDFEISDLPKGAIIGRVWFASANVTALKVERDGFTVFERTKAENDVIQADGVRTPQTGYFVYDPNELGYGAESLVTAGVQDLRFTVTMSAAGSLPVTVEYLGGLES